MKQVAKYIFLFGLIVSMVGCLAPMSKESYLEKFGRFVDRVETNYKNYNSEDWKWSDSQFEKYNGVWYQKYKEEFTLSDQIKIKSYIIRYHSYREKEDIGEILKQLFKEDVDEVRGKVKKYIEDDMEDDLDVLREGAAAIGDSAVNVLEDIIHELEESF